MNKHILFAVLGFILTMVSCKKDTIVKNDCEPPKTIVQEIEPCNMPDTIHYLPPCQSPTGIIFSNHVPAFGSPRFNPNNANELVFFENNSTSNIIKLEINSKVTTTLTNIVNSVNAQPYWASNGLIYYNGDDQYIHQIDPISLSATLLNFKLSDGNPIIDYGFAYTLSGTINWPGIYYKNNTLGQHIDSVYLSPNYVADLSSNKIFAYTDSTSTGYNISLLSYPSGVRTIVRLTNFMDVGSNQYISDIKWHPNNQDLYFIKQLKQLYKINIVTKKLTLVKRSDNWISFDSFALSPNGNKIVMAHTIYNIDYSQTVPSPCKLITSNYFTIMDLNGCNEQLLYVK